MARRPAGTPEPESEPEPVAPSAVPSERPARVRTTPKPKPAEETSVTEVPEEATPTEEPDPPQPTRPVRAIKEIPVTPSSEEPVPTEEPTPPEKLEDEGTPTPTVVPSPPARPVTAPSAGNITPMLQDKRIGIIGAGAMGGALCRGLIHANAAPANRILVSDPHTEHVQNLQKSLNIKVAESNVQVAKYTDIILLCVKPYNVAPVLDEISESLHRDAGKPLPLLISIAAGVTLAKLESHLQEPIPVVRAMPNTPAQVGKGACAYSRGTHTDAAHLEWAEIIFKSVGTALEVPETLMDAVTGLSGSGPAYVYLMIESLIDGGVKAGLPRDVAHQLASQTVLGAAQMVIETGMHPAQLRDMVTTPAGTTIAAIAALEQSGLRAALIDAVERATNRSRELG